MTFRLSSWLLASLSSACTAELAGSGVVEQDGGSLVESDSGQPPDGGQLELDATRSQSDGSHSDLDAQPTDDAGGTSTKLDAQPPALDGTLPDAGAHEAGADASPVDAQPDTAAPEAALCSRGPVDIVWAIDGSVSMQGEIVAIGSRLMSLMRSLTAAGADVRMTVLSSFDPVALGSDEPSANYHFVLADVQNSNLLAVLLSDFSQYAPWLRPGVPTDVLVASDGDSTLEVASFTSQLQALLGHPFTFHALAEPSYLFGSCATAEQPGVHYEALTTQTGGVFQTICTSNWSASFDALSAGVISDAPLVCP